MNIHRRALLALCLPLTWCSLARAQQFDVGGIVISDVGNPLFSGLAEVTVTLEGGGGSFSATTTSGGQDGQAISGLWTIQDVPVGAYVLEAAAPDRCFDFMIDLEPMVRLPVVITVGPANEAFNLNFQLLGSDGPCPEDPCEVDLDCRDGLFCNGGERCVDGACLFGEAVNCPAGEPCAPRDCSDAAAACVQILADDGWPCDDGDDCTLDDACVSGECHGAEDPNCGGGGDPGGGGSSGGGDGTSGGGDAGDAGGGLPGDAGQDPVEEDLCPDDPGKTEPGVCGCGLADDDSDEDGVPDCMDLCPDDADKTTPGTCGCGVSEEDADDDGVPDCADQCPADPDKTLTGACGCGTPDADRDGDQAPDCVDACPDDPDKQAPGLCGCGVDEDDSDLDGVPDCADECPGDPLDLCLQPAAAADEPCGLGCGSGGSFALLLTLSGLITLRRKRIKPEN